MKTVVGLFGNQVDAERAVEILVKKELDSDLKVIHPWESDKRQTLPAKQGEKERTERGIFGNLVSMINIGVQKLTSGSRLRNADLGDLTHDLIDRGFPEEDIAFFQEGLDRGGTILVLEVEKGDIPQVEDILGDAQVVLH